MFATIWLHDSAGAWLSDITDDAGTALAEIAHCPSLRGPAGAKVRIDGEIEHGLSLITIHARKWTLIY